MNARHRTFRGPRLLRKLRIFNIVSALSRETIFDIELCLPMNKNIAIPQSSSVNEIVAQTEVLRQVLVRGVRSHDAEVVLVLGTNKIMENLFN